MSSIILLGASGYIGKAFVDELTRRDRPFVPVSRREVDYTRFDVLLQFLRETTPAFLINAAGYTGKPNVDACEVARADTLLGNAMLPQTIAHACEVARIPWGHVSSGCIYSGAKIVTGTQVRVEKDLTRPDLRALVEESPESIRGFTEDDPPNFSFRDPPCSFYSGTKALGEEVITGQAYVWRLRIPFDEYDNSRNYLSKVQRYAKVYDNVNSISHRADFVRACLDLWEQRAPFGTYNVTNPGFVTTRQVVEAIQQRLKPGKRFEFWESDEAFYREAAKAPRSNCVLDVTKLLSTGVRIRPVQEALDDALARWRPET
ncbi:MAG TPA: sugar nucleotide-binding protein [Verrucomicrobia bacterium]|nr:sugar nucleotide-binding protein [Verrucomicrobiota bacterium]HOB33225.1 sugar nucleotide-binding protein [Verrucomicrobiota bacterium]HOP96117.1 sugar nucleotide-binding protein [Verrucomicrobiota bacterium]